MTPREHHEAIERFDNALKEFQCVIGQAILETWIGRKIARVLLWLEALHKR